jgi:regulator of sigma E protease
MFTLIVFLLVISVLIFVHEFGHFIVAKRVGMRVDEFGFGFPPRIWGFRYRGTDYTINLIPFGGFVRIYGEDGEHAHAKGSFAYASFWSRLMVIVAGVCMNIVLAIVLLVACNSMGLRVGLFDDQMKTRAEDRRVQILQVSPDSPAEKAGLQPLDEILGFRGPGNTLEMTDSPEAVQQFAFEHAGDPAVIVVQRGSTEQDILLALRKPSGPSQGPIGISLALTGIIRYPWYESIWRGIIDAWLLLVGTLFGYWGLLKSLFSTGHLGADITGPVGIATMTGQAARVGFTYLIQFAAMISVNLAVLNIFPFPALDGGRAVLVIAEKLRGKPLGAAIERTINSFGFLVLLLLMVAVTIKDIVKFF